VSSLPYSFFSGCCGSQLKVRIPSVTACLVLNYRIAAVGVGELNESTSKELEDVQKALAEKTQALQAAQEEIQTLKAKISGSNGGS